MGDDVRHLRRRGINSWGWDPTRRSDGERDFTPMGQNGDGYVTLFETLQNLYEQGEFKSWLEIRLGEGAVAADPGIFYVFRDASDHMGVLTSRYIRRSRAGLLLVTSSIDEHKGLLRPLIAFFEDRARAPVDDGELIRERFESLFSIYRRACEEADLVLNAVGDMKRARRTAQHSAVGKPTPSTFFCTRAILRACRRSSDSTKAVRGATSGV